MLCVNEQITLLGFYDLSVCLFGSGIAVDGTGKHDRETICMFKKKGKVKELDAELYSESCLYLLFTLTLITCS